RWKRNLAKDWDIMRGWRLLLAAGLLPVLGCSGGGVRIDGAGATFVEPLMKKWTYLFNAETGTELGYQGTGSGNGIDQVIARTVDFGCSAAAMSEGQLRRAEEAGGGVIHLPLVMGAVAVVYNLPGVDGVNLSGPVVADIYLGKI